MWLGLGDRALLHLGDRELEIGYQPHRTVLPFSVRLDRFTIDRYQGSHDPSAYWSKVTVLDGQAEQSAVIRMNEPLTHSGFTLYQSSYEDGVPRPMVSVFAVNRDPGRPWKYLGSLLLVLGSILLFASRYFKKMGGLETPGECVRMTNDFGNQPATNRTRSPHSRRRAGWACLLSLVAFALPAVAWPDADKAASANGPAGAAAAAPANPHEVAPGAKLEPHAGWDFSEISRMPIQNGGRLKPLDSFARETVLFETGSRSFAGWKPIDLLFSWLAHPGYWQDQPFIQIDRLDVRRQLGLDEKHTRFSPRELMENFALAQYANSMESAQRGPETQTNPTKDKNDPRTQELRRVLDRVGLFRAIVAGVNWTVVPPPAATVDLPGGGVFLVFAGSRAGRRWRGFGPLRRKKRSAAVSSP